MAAPSQIRSPSISINTTNYLNRVTVSWQPPVSNGGKPIKSYLVQYKVGQAGAWTYVAASGLPYTGLPGTATTRSITHTLGNNTNTAYKVIYYRVGVSNADGVTWTELPNSVTPLAPYPNAPVISAVASNVGGQASITIGPRTPSAPISSYNIRYRIVGSQTWLSITVAAPSQQPIVVTLDNLNRGANYEFSASASNSAGTGPVGGITAPLYINMGPPTTPEIISVQDVATWTPRLSPLAIGPDSPVHGFTITWRDTSNSRATLWAIDIKTTSSSTWSNYLVMDNDAFGGVRHPSDPSLRRITMFSFAGFTPNYPVPGETPKQHAIWFWWGFGIPEDVYQIRIRAVTNNSFSSYSNTITFDSRRNPLFDRRYLNVFDIPPRHLNLINQAMDTWEKYIRYNKQVFAAMKNFFGRGEPSVPWGGLDLVAWYEINQNADIIASAQVYTQFAADLPGVGCMPSFYALTYNAFYESQSDAWWLKVWTHELGHALGIGSLWVAGSCPGAVPPVNNVLSGSAYTKAQSAYNKITNTVRSVMPLESTGGDGTAGVHWEDSYRPATNLPIPFMNLDYYGLTDELMIGFFPENVPNPVRVLSSLTIKALIDLGFEEIVPGASEGTPQLATSIMSQSVERKAKCGGVINLPLPDGITINKNG